MMVWRLRSIAWKGVALLLAAGCTDIEPPGIGALEVAVSTTGGDFDLNGYYVTVDGVPSQPVGINGTAVIAGLPTGSHDVELGGVAVNCTVARGTHRSVIVTHGDTVRVAYAVGCVATGFLIRTSTTGIDIDPDGYFVSVDGGTFWAVPVSGSVTITRLSAGSHSVALEGVAANCVTQAPHPRFVTVATGDTALVAFAVTCGAVTGSITVTAVTAGVDPDPDGYSVRLDGGSTRPLPPNGAATFEGVTAGDHSVTLDSVAVNCTVGDENPRTVSVTTGGRTRDTARTTFQVSCVSNTAIAALEVTAVTSGVNLDPNGYMVHVDGGPWRPLPTNGVATIDGLSGGDHTVQLDDVAGNCLVSDENPRTVHLTTGGATKDTARTTFQVTCFASSTGTLEVAAVTSGADFDQNGYTVLVDYVCDYYYGCYYGWSEPVAVNGIVAIPNVPIGNHTVWLADVAPNCVITGPTPRTATVPPGDTARVAFAVTCELTGSVQVTAATSGIDPDPDGYRVTVDGVAVHTSAAVATNGSVTISRLPAGDYSVALGGAAVNCDVGSPNPRAVTVAGGVTAVVAFDVACVPVTRLAYASVADGNAEIYVVNSNGTGATRLTTNSVADLEPAWSPDGSKIAFRSERDGNAEIYVMDANGSSPTRLTNHALGDDSPVWSPDGGKIAFVSARDGNAEIYVMDADGMNPVRLTTHGAYDIAPAWSPDGSKIAFVSGRDNAAGEIYVMNRDGSAVTQLTTGTSWGVAKPAWSPDGARLAFSRIVACDYYYCESDIFVMNADGSSVTQLTPGPEDHYDPAWSPDGRWIAFTAGPCSYYDGCSAAAIKVVRVNGTDLMEITSGPVFDPAWRR